MVLKGAHTCAGPARHCIANPALASGDVLAGCMMAQGLAPFDAAVCDAYVHGAAGERRRARHGNTGLLAGKLTDLVPDVIGALSAQQWLPSCLT